VQNERWPDTLPAQRRRCRTVSTSTASVPSTQLPISSNRSSMVEFGLVHSSSIVQSLVLGVSVASSFRQLVRSVENLHHLGRSIIIGPSTPRRLNEGDDGASDLFPEACCRFWPEFPVQHTHRVKYTNSVWKEIDHGRQHGMPRQIFSHQICLSRHCRDLTSADPGACMH
jgi:hypothetical protein